MALLERRVDLLNETWAAERQKAELFTRKASQARANLAALVPGGRQFQPLGSVRRRRLLPGPSAAPTGNTRNHPRNRCRQTHS